MPRDLAWFPEMVLWSLALPILRRVVRIQRLASVMWAPPKLKRSEELDAAIAARAALLARFRPSGRANCLERSLLLYRFLGRAGADPRLILGVASANAAVRGHAWVEVDGESLFDSVESLDQFEPILVFGDGGVVVRSSDHVAVPRTWE